MSAKRKTEDVVTDTIKPVDVLTKSEFANLSDEEKHEFVQRNGTVCEDPQ